MECDSNLFLAYEKRFDEFPGWTPATLVQDYTHIISLSSSNILVFNCLTGKSWKGPKHAKSFGIAAVEDYQGNVQSAEKFLQIEKAMMRHEQSQLSIVLIPSYGCNLSCEYCYEGKLTSNFQVWRLDDVPHVIETCLKLIELEVKTSNIEFTFLGGEPIRKATVPIIGTIIKELKNHGAERFLVVTNGLELPENAIRLAQCGLSGVMITIDGPSAIHDVRRPSRCLGVSSFERAMVGIEKCLGLGMAVTVRVNIDQRNVPYLGELADIFETKGLFNYPLFSSYLYPVTSDFCGRIKLVSEAELARLLEAQFQRTPQIKKFRWNLHGLQFIYSLQNGQASHPLMHFCGASVCQYVIDVEFNLYTCWFGVNKPGFQVGKFQQETGILSIKDRLLREWRSRSVAALIPCRTCKWALLCGGGCGFKAFERTGKVLTPNCADFATILEACGRIVYESI